MIRSLLAIAIAFTLTACESTAHWEADHMLAVMCPGMVKPADDGRKPDPSVIRYCKSRSYWSHS